MNKTGQNQGAGIIWIFFRGIGIYIGNFLPFSRAMLFPVFGQLAGIALVLGPVYFFRQYLVKIPPEALQQHVKGLIICLILMIIPGFMVFMRAFWDYMVVMASTNTMVADITKKDNFGDFKAHNNAVNLRKKDYITLLLLLTGLWVIFILVLAAASMILGNAMIIFILISLLAVLALFTVSVWLCLAFQVFVFETLTPVETLKRSYYLTKNNFWRAVLLGVIVNILMGMIIPSFIQSIFEIQPILSYITIPFKAYCDILVENPMLATLPENIQVALDNIPKVAALSTIGMLVTAFTLPLGSACFTLLYMDLKKRKDV